MNSQKKTLTFTTKHYFHVLKRSSLPFFLSGLLLLLTINLVFYLNPKVCSVFNSMNTLVLQWTMIALTLTSLAWFASIINESGKGFHTLSVQMGLRAGFLLFLVSEAMLFFAFFWSYFHLSVNPSVSINHQWPPVGSQPLDTWGIPLANTLLLLTSGLTANCAHGKLLSTNFSYSQHKRTEFFIYLALTLILGYVFLASQYVEYRFGLQQSWSSNVFWSVFFLLTGFHGVHVVVGTLFLQYNFVREIMPWAVREIIRHLPTDKN